MIVTDPDQYNYRMVPIDTVDDKFSINPNLVQYLIDNQHKHLTLSTEHYSLSEAGLYDLLDCFIFASVTIYTWNVLEQHPKYIIKMYPSKLYMFDQSSWGKWDIRAADLEWDYSKRFITMFGRPTAFRLGIASYLHAHHYQQSQIYIAADPNSSLSRHQFNIVDLYTARKESLLEFALIEPKLPLMPKDAFYDQQLWRESSPYLQCYRHSLIDIVVEPMLAGTVFNPTEKIVRPMLLKKPYIAMGPKHMLKYIKQMGFKTFDSIWDESYDGLEGAARYREILSLIDTIALMPESAVHQMYEDITSVLVHNRQLLVDKSYNTNVRPYS